VRFSDPLRAEVFTDPTVDKSKILFLGQEHSYFKVGDPDPGATQACRAQMATFLATGTTCTPAVSNGKYTGQCN